MRKKWKSIAAWILIAGLCTCSIQVSAAPYDDVPDVIGDEEEQAGEAEPADEAKPADTGGL